MNDSPTRTEGLAAGAALAGVALLSGELFASASRPAPIVAIGDTVIDLIPSGLRQWGIDTFGTNDKAVLITIIVAALLLIAALIGRGALGPDANRAVGVVSTLGFVGAVATLASTRSFTALLPTVVATGATLGVIPLLRRLRTGDRTVDAAEARAAGSDPPAAVVPPMRAGASDRRRFIATGSALGAASAAAAFGLARVRSSSGETELAGRLPLPGSTPGARVSAIDDIEGISPYYTPTEDFYRIDTALVVPRVNVSSWRLRVTGMVESELDFGWDELLDRYEAVEADVTLSCVSNEVGGELVGNARWLGFRLADVLRDAGVDENADQVVGRSVDGFTAGFPIAAAIDGRDSLIAIGMNGEPLPRLHGAPARLVVPGLYGYVSATKWLTEIELTRFDRFEGYWIPRGWSADGPIKTQSRIDTPRNRHRLDAGTVPVAGVAWAPHRGISAVEVRVDDGEWQQARLAPVSGDDTWCQWLFEWEATRGAHTLTVRATDGDGAIQTAELSDVAPDGATGHHSIRIDIA